MFLIRINLLNGNWYQKVIHLSFVYNKILDEMESSISKGSKEYVDVSGYEYLIGNSSQFSTVLLLIIYILSITLCTSLSISSIYQIGFKELITTTKYRKEKINIDKLIFFSITIFLAIILFGIHVTKLKQGYQLLEYNYQLNSLVETTSTMNFIYILLLGFTVTYTLMQLSKKSDTSIVLNFIVVIAIINGILYFVTPYFTLFGPLSIESLYHPLSILFNFILLISINLVLGHKLSLYIKKNQPKSLN